MLKSCRLSGSFVAVALSMVAFASAAHARSRMTMQCQQNTEDHRTLVANGDMLPAGATYKILRYKPVRRDGIWTYGPCELELR